MTPDEMQIAIAEKCGWTEIRVIWVGSGGGDTKTLCGLHPVTHKMMTVPDYLTDLNAMHEAEKVLTHVQQCVFIDTLDAVIRLPENIAFGDKPTKKFRLNHFGRFAVANATAAQRAEAFLRTINKRDDTK